MEHISTVENGMFMDNDPRYQPKGTYYDSMDGEIIDNGNNSYLWRNRKGNELSFEVSDLLQRPIGFCKLRDKLIIFSTSTAADQISYVNITSTGVGATVNSIALYAGDLNFSESYMIEAVSSPETSKYQRIYWVDDRNQPRTLNISNIVYVASPNLVIGQQYLVVSHSISTLQGGVATTITLGNSFIAEANTFTGTGLVIEYIDPSMLNFAPSFTVGEIFFNRFISGNLMSGGYFVAAQYESDSGVISDWSIITDCIPVYKEIGPGNIVAYQAAPGHNTVTVPLQTGRGIRMTIRNIDQNFNKMRLSVFYSDDLDVIQPGYVLGDIDITATEMTYDIVEYLGLPITIEELLLKGPTIEKAGTIAIIKNQLVIGRLSEENNVDADNLMIPASPTLKSLYELPCDQRIFHYGLISDSPVEQVGHNGYDVDTGGVASGSIYPGQWYRVDGGVITYSGIDYGLAQPLQHFLGVYTSVTYVVVSGTPILTPVIRISEYTDNAGTTHYKYYDINASWLDYKNPLVCQLIKGFYGGERYRMGLLPISLTNKQLRTIWLEDIDIPYRNNKIAGGPNYPLMKGYNKIITDPLGDYHLHWNLNIMSLLYNLDISEFVDGSGNPLIKGFCIVAAPLDKKIISDVFYTHSYYTNFAAATDQLCCPYSLIANYKHLGAGLFFLLTRYDYLKYLYSPEFLYDISTMPVEEIKLKYLDIFDAELPLNHAPEYALDPLWTNPIPFMFKNGVTIAPVVSDTRHLMFQKFYHQSEDATLYAGKETESAITKNVLLSLNNPVYYYTVEATSAVIEVVNSAHVYEEPISYIAEGAGERCYLIEIKDTTLGPDYRSGTMTDEYDPDLRPMLHYGTIERTLAEPYGGSSVSSIENTTYRFLGHYLELTSDVIADALQMDGSYKLYNIQVFGQDTYVYPWDLARLYPQWWTDSYTMDGRYLGHCICAPIQSTVNIALRRDRHVARNRYTDYLNGYYTDGIYYNLATASTDWRLDLHLYEKGFSSKFNDQIFLAYVDDTIDDGIFDYRFRWSNVKIYGEYDDSYLVFGAFNFKDLDPAKGRLTNLRSKMGRLYYWQEDVVGYIPVGERALVSANTVAQVELGTGSSFARYDDALSICGNLHQFSMIETANSFIWCDWKRRNIIMMGLGFEKIEFNKVKGIDKFVNSMTFNYSNRWSPVAYNGIGACYDEKENKAIISFLCYAEKVYENKSMLINLDTQKPITQLSNGVSLSINVAGYTLQCNPALTREVYVWDRVAAYQLFGVDMAPYLTILINPQSVKEGNMFDNCILTGNENFCSTVTYSDTTDGVSENVISTANVQLSRYYRYYNKKWHFSIPLINGRKRFQDDIIYIKFAINVTRKKIVGFLSLLTVYRKTK